MSCRIEPTGVDRHGVDRYALICHSGTPIAKEIPSRTLAEVFKAAYEQHMKRGKRK